MSALDQLRPVYGVQYTHVYIVSLYGRAINYTSHWDRNVADPAPALGPIRRLMRCCASAVAAAVSYAISVHRACRTTDGPGRPDVMPFRSLTRPASVRPAFNPDWIAKTI